MLRGVWIRLNLCCCYVVCVLSWVVSGLRIICCFCFLVCLLVVLVWCLLVICWLMCCVICGFLW